MNRGGLLHRGLDRVNQPKLPTNSPLDVQRPGCVLPAQFLCFGYCWPGDEAAGANPCPNKPDLLEALLARVQTELQRRGYSAGFSSIASSVLPEPSVTASLKAT